MLGYEQKSDVMNRHKICGIENKEKRQKRKYRKTWKVVHLHWN